MCTRCFAQRSSALGSATKSALLTLALIALGAAFFLNSSEQTPLSDAEKLEGDQEQVATEISRAETLRLDWQQLRERLDKNFHEIQNAADASQGLETFISARNSSIKDLEDLLEEATTAVAKLEEKQRYFADSHVQSLLPPEVLPQLDEALRHQLKDLKALKSEVHTVQTQLLPDIHSRLKRLHAACDLKEQINGSIAARQLWQEGAAGIATLAALHASQ